MEEDSTNTYVGSVVWICVYSTIICAAVFGNILTILAITASRQLSSMVSNQFIFSLAVSDLLVGLTVPYHMCFFKINTLGDNKDTCLVRFVLISFGCASSILNLFFVAFDRYTAVVHPLKYNKHMTRETSAILIFFVWMMSLTLSTVLIYWNAWEEVGDCNVKIIPDVYFNFVLTPLFVLTWSVMLLVYIKIWREAAKHAKRIRNTTNIHNCHSIKDTKSIQVMRISCVQCY